MKEKVINSIKWSAFAEIASKVLPPLFYILTARILTPEDFGVVATSSMVVAFASILWEAGLSKALIQNQEFKVQKMSNIVFYTNVVLSFLIYLIIFIFSDFISSFFKDFRVSNVLKVSGLSLIIGSFMSVQTALLQRNFEFKKLFYSRFVGAIIPGIVSVLLAYYGYGYWALVLGSIASMILQAIILWKISEWRPSLEYDIAIAKKMFEFSKWVFLSSLLSWFYIWGDIFVLGFFFTSHEVGLYRTGNYFVSTIFGFVTTPVLPVMYSYFSNIQHNVEEVKRVLLLSSKILSFIVLPIGVGLYILQNPLSDLIFGNKWEGIEPVIGYLALMHGFSWIIGLNNSAYAAIGRPDIETKILIVSIFLYLTVYILSAQVNFEFFIFARFILAVISIFIHIYASKITIKTDFLEIFGNIKFILIIIILIFVINSLLLNNFIFNYFKVLIMLLISIIVYLIFLYLFDRKLIRIFQNVLKRRDQIVS